MCFGAFVQISLLWLSYFSLCLFLHLGYAVLFFISWTDLYGSWLRVLIWPVLVKKTSVPVCLYWLWHLNLFVCISTLLLLVTTMFLSACIYCTGNLYCKAPSPSVPLTAQVKVRNSGSPKPSKSHLTSPGNAVYSGWLVLTLCLLSPFVSSLCSDFSTAAIDFHYAPVIKFLLS